jgi:hypothetical protein
LRQPGGLGCLPRAVGLGLGAGVQLAGGDGLADGVLLAGGDGLADGVLLAGVLLAGGDGLPERGPGLRAAVCLGGPAGELA